MRFSRGKQGKHRNSRQETAFCDFMKKHPDIARKLTKGNRVAVTAAWEDLAIQLNTLGPPIKTVEEWRIIWKDWKTAIKKKITYNKMETRANGGGPFNKLQLTSNEVLIAKLCHLYEMVDVVTGSIAFGILQPKEDTIKDEDDAISPKRQKMAAASDINEKAPTDNRLAVMVADETTVLKDIKNELVELRKTNQEMLDERKKTNLILAQLVLAIETKFK